MVLLETLEWLLAAHDGWYDPLTLSLLTGVYASLYAFVGFRVHRLRLRLPLQSQPWPLRDTVVSLGRRLHLGHYLPQHRLTRLPRTHIHRCSWRRWSTIVLLGGAIMGAELLIGFLLFPTVAPTVGIPLEVALVLALGWWTAGSVSHPVESRFAAGSLLVAVWLVGHPALAVVVPCIAFGILCIMSALVRIANQLTATATLPTNEF